MTGTHAAAPLPLTVIGGFLGAGKTTLLNRWLRDAQGLRLAVLVNDFGALNIDAALIEASGGGAIALSNGCVCCQIGDDLSAALIGVLDQRARYDAVVVEASGVSDPWRVAQFARADPALSLDGVIVLVDASCALAQSRDPLLADTLLRQLASADLVVLNKADLADAGERAAALAWIAEAAGAAHCIETTHSAVPMAMLTRHAMPQAQRSGPDDQRPAHEHGHGHEHDHGDHGDHDHAHAHAHDDPSHGTLFDTWSARPAAAFDADALRGWLRRPPPGLLRLKGFVRAVDGGWLALQFAGRHGAAQRCGAPDDGPAVVAIGLRGRLPAGELDAWFGTAAA